jgi:ribose 5-phosphate isomerase A
MTTNDKSIDKEAGKKAAARAALKFIDEDMVIGVGSGSTVHHFIDALASIKDRIIGAVSSSEESANRLKALSIPVLDLNSVGEVPLYVDGADEVNLAKQMIKGGGAALTREKSVAAASKKFVCIVDESKVVDLLGEFPVAVEVIPMARSYVAREIVLLGGDPEYREGCVTDNGNNILDVYNLKILEPRVIEEKLKNITGVIENGVFAKRTADVVIVGSDKGVRQL